MWCPSFLFFFLLKSLRSIAWGCEISSSVFVNPFSFYSRFLFPLKKIFICFIYDKFSWLFICLFYFIIGLYFTCKTFLLVYIHLMMIPFLVGSWFMYTTHLSSLSAPPFLYIYLKNHWNTYQEDVVSSRSIVFLTNIFLYFYHYLFILIDC